ncbi:MAG TPA: FAD-binding oxidoreductase, partial [Actinocrinis sp.]
MILPDSPDYDAARRLADPRFDNVLPQAVVRCGTPTDVAEAIALARRHGLHAVPRSGGHSFAGRSTSTGVIIDVAPMHDVRPDGDFAVIGAGARLGEVYDGLARVGRTIAAGCGPAVGIAGLTLGGGLGILGRSHGLTSDQLVAARVVLPDGRIVECDDRREPDLFWALRGSGGGNFGVVTSLTFRTLPVPPSTVL